MPVVQNKPGRMQAQRLKGRAAYDAGGPGRLPRLVQAPQELWFDQSERTRRGQRGALVGQHRDDDAPMRILALATTVDLVDVGHGIVDDLSINTIHRLESDVFARV